MKEKPILFITPMVQAILRGEKTQTRRVMKPQIEPCNHHLYKEADWKGEPTKWSNGYREEDKEYWYCGLCGNGVSLKDLNGIKCPYGKVGDVLWVRETWQHTKCLNVNFEDENYGYVYKADGQPWDNYENWTWKPSIFMPKEACRIKLEITDIRVERLNEISDYNALCEGIPVELPVAGLDVDIDGGWWPNRAKEHYKRLWESINGKGSWDDNPYVWVIEFKRIS